MFGVGENRGFAHVEYQTVEEASAAVKTLLGSSQAPVLAGKNVTIGFAQTNMRDEPSNTLFLSRFQGDRADIRDAFQQFEPEVVKVKFGVLFHFLLSFPFSTCVCACHSGQWSRFHHAPLSRSCHCCQRNLE